MLLKFRENSSVINELLTLDKSRLKCGRNARIQKENNIEVILHIKTHKKGDNMKNKLSKRDQVLNYLQPIAKAIGVEIDYTEKDDAGREYLTCNNQNICTSGNSVHAIINEFWGYVFITRYDRYHAFEKHQKNVIKRYWYDKNFNQPFL